MSLIEDIPKQVRSISINDNISRMVDRTIKKQQRIDRRPSDYFYLTELVNPIQAYWARTRPETTISRELTKKLLLGTKLGRISGIWFRKLPDFVTQEARLDGAYVGINGVVGKIDYRIGESIIEFKTKPEHVLDTETIFRRFPQDLEQLLFYAALSSNATDTNYLVFMTDFKPHTLTAFKIKINNIGDIKNLLKQRRDSLNKALKDGDPKYLKRCRYLDFDCEFKEDICDCDSRPVANTEVIRRNIEILRDKEFENQLEEIRQVDGTKLNDVFSCWSLFSPRKWFFQTMYDEVETYERSQEKDIASVLLSSSVFRDDEMRLTEEEKQDVKGSELDLPIRVPHSNFIKLIGTGSDGPTKEIVPYIARASLGKTRMTPTDYHISELGISCVKFGVTKGVVFVIYPEVNDHVVGYVITYDNIKKIEANILQNIALLSKAVREDSVELLDKCPNWMCDTCGYESYCT